jgi:hypothetical protein
MPSCESCCDVETSRITEYYTRLPLAGSRTGAKLSVPCRAVPCRAVAAQMLKRALIYGPKLLRKVNSRDPLRFGMWSVRMTQAQSRAFLEKLTIA